MGRQLSIYVATTQDNTNQSYRECEKKATLKYTTLHTPQLNGIIEIRFAVIKEGALAMLLNSKLNDAAQKILWAEAVHTYKHVRKIMANTVSTKSSFGN